MRLHRLTMTAFGPFAGREEVDFDALTTAGLFLFTGATGAGKTSILDAICFALYGQVPGARQASRLRSEHSAGDIAPEVCLELTLKGRRIRVTRSPAWERPKRRGSGVATQQAKVIVAELAEDDWHTVATRLDEAGQLLAALIGLSMAQFCQVVLLPQGQFAEFLRADADRRRDVLETLFDTQRFSAVEAELVEFRRSASRLLEASDETLGCLLARAAEVRDLEGPPDGLAPEDALAWLSELHDAASARALAASDAEESARAHRASAEQEFRRTERLHRAQARVRALNNRRAELLAEVPAVSALVVELETARLAAPVLPLWRAVIRLDEELGEAVGQVARTRHAVSSYVADAGAGSLADPVHLRVRATGVRAEIAGLERLVDDEMRADQITGELAALERTVVALDAQTAELATWLDTAPTTRAQLEAAVAKAARDLDRLPDVEAARGAAQTRFDAARRRDRLAGELARRSDDLREAVDKAQAARKQALDLREMRLLGMAAELAGALADGVPCVVCGSPEHPQPAQSVDGAVTRGEDEAAEAVAQAEERRILDAQAALGKTEVSLADARAVAGDATTTELQSALALAELLLDEVRVGAAALDAAERDLHRFRIDEEHRLQQRMAIDGEARRVRERTTMLRAQVADLRHEVARARGSDPTVRARADRLSRLAVEFDSLTDALIAADRIRRDLDAARDRAAAAAKAAGFDDVASVPAHIRDDARLSELEEQRARHVAELSSVEALLADADLAEITLDPAADVESARSAVDAAEAEHQRRIGEKHGAQRCLSALARLSRELGAHLDARAPLARRHAVADQISKLVEGKSADNRLRMSLSAYVLAGRLEHVASAASHRLLAMSSGRYSLVHTDVPGAGRGGRGGLHLRVFDSWTGRERDPRTLSGGETFAASLALALGLADVVTAEAGGSLLETLFVDEGFGSLDDDTLDEVMCMLDGLRSGGRMVGIVSHVADLRQRIPTQLQVVKKRHGSTVRQ